MGTAVLFCSPAEGTEQQDKKEPTLHKALHCYCGKRETSTDKAQTERQSTATTWKKKRQPSQTPTLVFCPLPLPSKPNQCLSVHLST